MATKAFKALTEKDLHAVGNLNTTVKNIVDVPNGALFTEDVDNFTAVELGFDAEGNRTAKSVTDITKKTYIPVGVERRFLGENIAEFYNGTGERGRIVVATDTLRFETSAFELNTGVTEVKKGQSAHFNVVTKKYLIHDGTHLDFATAYLKLLVVGTEEDLDYTLGSPLVRFEVQ